MQELDDIISHIAKIKLNISPRELCQGEAHVFLDFVESIYSLEYE